ncbi:MAG: nucleotidyltransferase domain-containing protein, partial [Bacteroidota bacterium]
MNALGEYEKEKIARFLFKKYPNCLTAVLSGSIVDNTADENSDLDIVLFVSDRNQLYNETLRFEKHKLQTFVIPFQHLYERLYADYVNAKCHFIGLLAKGQHFFGDKALSNAIVQHSIELERAGPKPMSASENLGIRTNITQLLAKLSNSRESWENRLLYVGAIADQLIGFKLHSENTWKGDGKHRMKFLEAHAPEFKKEILAALQDAFTNKSYKRLIELSQNEINVKGGLVDFFPKKDIQLTPNDDYLVLKIKFWDNLEQLKGSIALINELLLKLKKNDSFDFYFYSTYFTGGGIASQDVLCVVCAANGWLNDFFIDWFHNEKEKHGLKNVFFPIFIDPKYKFVSPALYQKILPVFLDVSRYNLKNTETLLSESFQIYSALSLLKTIKSYFNHSRTSFQDFLLFLFKNYLVASYDTAEITNSNELIKKRGEILSQYEA